MADQFAVGRCGAALHGAAVQKHGVTAMADMRMIDANHLSKEVEESKRHNPHFDGAVRRTHDHEHDHFLRMIDDAPTIDAVPVVRCKDCKHWHTDDDVGHCDNPDGLDNYARPDDFCSYGERKDSEG